MSLTDTKFLNKNIFMIVVRNNDMFGSKTTSLSIFKISANILFSNEI